MGERVTSLRAAAGVLLICSLATSVVFAAACCSIYVVFLLKAVFAFIARLILTLGEILVAVVAAIASGTRYKKIAQKCFFGGIFYEYLFVFVKMGPHGSKKIQNATPTNRSQKFSSFKVHGSLIVFNCIKTLRT